MLENKKIRKNPTKVVQHALISTYSEAVKYKLTLFSSFWVKNFQK